jgi:hypothetical protein
MLRCILCARWHGRGLPNQDEIHFVVWGCSKQGDMQFVFSLAWVGLSGHMLIFILCLLWHGRDLVYPSYDTFCVLAGIGLLWSTHVEMLLVSSLTLEAFGQHMLRYLLCPCWQRMGLIICILCIRWHWLGLVNTS